MVCIKQHISILQIFPWIPWTFFHLFQNLCFLQKEYMLFLILFFIISSFPHFLSIFLYQFQLHNFKRYKRCSNRHSPRLWRRGDSLFEGMGGPSICDSLYDRLYQTGQYFPQGAIVLHRAHSLPHLFRGICLYYLSE